MKPRSFFWDRYAQCYDGLRDALPYRRLVQQAVDCVPPGAATLLDAGCGTGNLLAAIRHHQRTIALHGIDFSEAMLRRARTKVADAQLILGDLNGPLPYSDGAFDAVTCLNVLYAVADPERTLAELRRVLKPGGALIVSSPLAQPRIGAFIQAHAADAGWLRTVPLLVRSAALILFNLSIVRRGSVGQYHFMDLAAAQKLLARERVTRAYANQNWFACATKN